MTDKQTLPPPPHVATDGRFDELLRVWVRRDSVVDGENQISLGVTMSETATVDEVVATLGAVATGFILQQPEIAHADREVQDYLVAQGVQQLLEQATDAACPLRPRYLVPPEDLMYEPGATNVVSLWIDPTVEASHTVYAGDPKALGAKTLGSLLATMLLEAGRNEDGTFDVPFIDELQDVIAKSTKAYLAEEALNTQ